MRQAIRQNRFALLLILLFEVVGLVLVALYSRNYIHLNLTNHHHSLLDAVFPYLTWLGDGNAALVFVIATLLFFDWRLALNVVVTYLVAGGITQLLKREVFDDHFRPFPELGHHALFYEVPGTEPLFEHSFPSGHATGAFALFVLLMLYAPRPRLKYLLLSLAFVGAWSRVYINQHFLQDILAGAAIGTVVAFVMFGLVENWRPRTRYSPLIPWKKFLRAPSGK
jgi:membrane-associated phospholipid phosphatase